LDGTPMPSYRDAIDPPQLWALSQYVLSLNAPPAATPRPTDPIAAGREVAAKYSCQGCHVLDDGKGGDVGPDLRVSAQKRRPEWVRAFLTAPRDYGKIYLRRVYRMPDLRLSKDEVDVMTKYLAAIGKPQEAPIGRPAAAGEAAGPRSTEESDMEVTTTIWWGR
jgi:mono/diheme cytochrome c family protein